MKATGIVRRIDDLGRVVIPKEIRRTLRIREGDALEIYTSASGEVIFKKYSPVGELGEFAGVYADVLSKASGRPVMVCDKDHVVAVAGLPKRELMDRRVSHGMDMLLARRGILQGDEEQEFHPVEGVEQVASACYPIISSSDSCGAIMYLSDHGKNPVNLSQTKLLETAAGFLGRVMES